MAPNNTPSKKPPRSWDALTPSLASWVLEYLEAKGFAQPTPVQAACLPLFRTSKDVVVEAVTGSGKTLSFVLPVVEKLLQAEEPPKRHHVQGIIVSPTRELATQTMNVVLELLGFHPESRDVLHYATAATAGANVGLEKRPDTVKPVVVPQLVVGGAKKASEDLRRFLSLSPTLIVGTPGRIAQLLSSPHVKTPVSAFQVLILDEADRLLDMGFSQDLSRIIGALPKSRRTGLFSASVTDAVQEIIKLGMQYPFKVTVRVRTKTGDLVEERKTPVALQLASLVVPARQKIAALAKLLRAVDPPPPRVIVFFATCHEVKYFQRVLPAVLPPQEFRLLGLHGKLEAAVRERCFAAFVSNNNTAAGTPTILLTTDLAARGLDIPQVDLVVQMDPPQDTKAFIHRAGRAGRAGRKGLSVVMLQPGHEAEGYTSLLAVRGTPVTPLSRPAVEVTDAEAEAASAAIRAQALADRDVFQLAQRAFVAWVRSYRERSASATIFRVADLDWPDLARGFGLLALPKMPELRGLDVDRSLGLGIDTEAVAFKDKEREKRRQAEMAEWRAGKAARALEDAQGLGQGQGQGQKRKKTEAWSAKHDMEDVRVARREKKRRKREAEKLGTMTEQEREEHRKLEDLIGEVRKKNQVTAAAAAKDDNDEFEGFDD